MKGGSGLSRARGHDLGCVTTATGAPGKAASHLSPCGSRGLAWQACSSLSSADGVQVGAGRKVEPLLDLLLVAAHGQ